MSRWSDTVIGMGTEETSLSRIQQGQQLRIAVGLLSGVEGTALASRSEGRVLVGASPGVMVEVDQYCVERVVYKCENKAKSHIA
jgi:hypothetical protein